MRRLLRSLLVLEALLCLALPLYFLFWGLISAPLWVGGLGTSATYLWWYVFDVVGGLLGVIGIAISLRYCVSNRSDRAFPATRAGILIAAGVLAVWQAPSESFSEVSFDLGTFLLAIVPTACALHLYLLALTRARKQSPKEPNKVLQDDARNARA